MKKNYTLLIMACLLFIGGVANAQGLPSDRERDGLKGNVRTVIVKEENIGIRPDTVFEVKSEKVVHHKYDTIKIFWFIPKYIPREEFVDSVYTVTSIINVPDTIHYYYYYAEYTPEGLLMRRELVEKDVQHHEWTVSTYDGDRQVETRTYFQKSGITLQRLYHYSDYEKNARLDEVTVIQYKDNDEGTLVERVLYEYENQGEICRERHISPNGDVLQTQRYQLGVLTDESRGKDTNIHYIYDDRDRISEVEYYTSYDLQYTDRYEYHPSGIKITRLYESVAESISNRPSVTVYTDEYDGVGNWTRRAVAEKPSCKRDLTYYGN